MMLGYVLLIAPGVYTILSCISFVMVGFVIGYSIRSIIIKQNKKKIQALEKEMLANHARILELEKEITELKIEKSKINSIQTSGPKVELKAS